VRLSGVTVLEATGGCAECSRCAGIRAPSEIEKSGIVRENVFNITVEGRPSRRGSEMDEQLN
jgi:hypothetical protein